MHCMTKEEISGGTVHDLPADLRAALAAAPAARTAWERITPLARNEWICWDITVKQPATRKNHIERTVAELQEGKRRPCCWMGCVHRKDKPISPSVQWVLGRRAKSTK